MRYLNSQTTFALICSTLILLMGAATSVQAQSTERPIALVGGMLLDGYEAPPLQDAAILIRGDSIVAVGPESRVRIPENARVIDTNGKTMLPGLIDLHVHLMILGHGEYSEWFPILTEHKKEVMAISAKQLLMAGVTTAADMGAPLEILAIRDSIAEGYIPGPRMLVSGPWITRVPYGGLPRYFQYSIDSPEEAADRAEELVAAGVDIIKTWVGMGEADIRAVAQVAHAAGLQVHSHVYEPEAIWAAIRGGTDVLQHVGSAGEMPYADSLIRTIAYQNIPVVPTMAHRIWVVPATIKFPERLDDPQLRHDFPPYIYEAVMESFEGVGSFHRLGYYHSTPRQIRYAKMGAASQFIEANVIVGMGTDSGSPANFHTESAWREIEAMVESGMTPLRAISASTKTGADILDLGDELGTIEPGKIADIIVVDGNPLANIRALDHVEWVVKNGTVYKSPTGEPVL